MSLSLDDHTILVTGGAGFIGSHLVRALLSERPGCRVITLDALTYAGNLANLHEVENNPRHRFVHADVCDRVAVESVVAEADVVFHLAAETHVDRSIEAGVPFARTDVVGTAVLFEAARQRHPELIVHISTDEVYGEIGLGRVDEEAPLTPRNPYSASKAGGDMLARAYAHTHGLPTVVVRPSNHFGPRQHIEKFIPVCVLSALREQLIPLYGDGRQQRDWLYVADGVSALIHIAENASPGDVYNIAREQERENRDVAARICELAGASANLIRPTSDRPGHDRRYAINAGRLRDLGWRPETSFDDGLAQTIDWYRNNRSWWEPLLSQAGV